MAYELKNAEISYISLVTKGANGRQFAIMKSATDKQPNISKQVPILKTEEEKQLVTGVVYEPDVEDSHGDTMTAEEIEKAAYTFMENYQHIDKQHDEIAGKGTVVENWIAKSDMTVGEQEVQAGTWLMTVRVDDADTWEEIKKGEVTGFSMGGFGERVEIAKTDDFTHEDKGLIRKMLDFVKGESHKITKGEVKDRFIDEKQKRDLRAVFNLFEDVFYWEIWESNPDIDRMAAALDDMKDILSSIKGGYTIAKSEDSVQAESIVLESIKKAGKVLSQKNHAKLDEALALISEIKEAASPQEEDEMKAEDIAEIVKQAVEPLATKLDKIEKQVNGEEVELTPEEQTEEEKAAAVIQKALEPITKRLENIENAASIRKGLDPDEEVTPGQQQIKKSKWAGLNL
ncbi:XkdF-like putative serine protease domain-containing protein [Bacillus sp. FSL L8-0199]|uniref:XkdF-like putative serine protease domain-containing protein n=1 Tax=Bacillus TaxID=1386 RepID=UPI0011A56664|nr:XkdF-like putative serine protease domain-containing protein [Bacillus cereus]MCU5146572.1 XkdF-like putative serine protease domain-containing protein [Bacillus cereus]MCU5493355.1 XkdF-like putative serine protease domain-containing protein [Bacillus cereus]MCU5635547.1 XkdF-like putative serine protease domain-containing protein [Bacillus cereus]MCU5700293.1 XkdF-like putative serine protease domain-containing protein [Bacillus cereus]